MKREEIVAAVGVIAGTIGNPPQPGSDADKAAQQAVVELTVDVLHNLGRIADALESLAQNVTAVRGRDGTDAQ